MILTFLFRFLDHDCSKTGVFTNQEIFQVQSPVELKATLTCVFVKLKSYKGKEARIGVVPEFLAIIYKIQCRFKSAARDCVVR